MDAGWSKVFRPDGSYQMRTQPLDFSLSLSLSLSFSFFFLFYDDENEEGRRKIIKKYFLSTSTLFFLGVFLFLFPFHGDRVEDEDEEEEEKEKTVIHFAQKEGPVS